MHNKKAQAWKRNSRPALLRLNILLSIQLDADVTVFVNDQFHVADVLIIELFSFFFCHADAGSGDRVVQHLFNVQGECLIQVPVQLVKKSILLDSLTVA